MTTTTSTAAAGVPAPPRGGGNDWLAEEWRPIAGFPQYKVSDQGRVLSCQPRWRTPRLMSPRTNVYGYLVVTLLDAEGIERPSLLVHRLVAEAFIGPRAAGMDTRHLDGDKAP